MDDFKTNLVWVSTRLGQITTFLDSDAGNFVVLVETVENFFNATIKILDSKTYNEHIASIDNEISSTLDKATVRLELALRNYQQLDPAMLKQRNKALQNVRDCFMRF